MMRIPVLLSSTVLLAAPMAFGAPRGIFDAPLMQKARPSEAATDQAQGAKAKQERKEAQRRLRARETREREADRLPAREAAAAPERRNEVRRLTREVFKLERGHRDRVGRMDRLKDVFRGQGNIEKLKDLEAMGERENRRYQRGLESFRRELGPDAFAALETALEVGRERERERPRDGDKLGREDIAREDLGRRNGAPRTDRTDRADRKEGPADRTRNRLEERIRDFAPGQSGKPKAGQRGGDQPKGSKGKRQGRDTRKNKKQEARKSRNDKPRKADGKGKQGAKGGDKPVRGARGDG